MTAINILGFVIGTMIGAPLGAFAARHILNAMLRRGWFV